MGRFGRVLSACVVAAGLWGFLLYKGVLIFLRSLEGLANDDFRSFIALLIFSGAVASIGGYVLVVCTSIFIKWAWEDPVERRNAKESDRRWKMEQKQALEELQSKIDAGEHLTDRQLFKKIFPGCCYVCGSIHFEVEATEHGGQGIDPGWTEYIRDCKRCGTRDNGSENKAEPIQGVRVPYIDPLDWRTEQPLA